MNPEILKKLSQITEEEQEILDGRSDIDRSLYMDGSRDVISGEKLLDKGKLIAIRPHTRFIAFPEHTHDYVEMVYMCRGSTTHIVNGERFRLETGELLMLGQNARQQIEAAGEEDVAVNFIVRPEFFSSVLPVLGEEETPLRHFILECLRGENESGYLLFHVAEILPVQNLIENLLYTMMEDIPNRRSILQLTMGLLFVQLLNHTQTLSFSSGEQEAVMTVLRYIEEHYMDGSLTEVAEGLHYELHSLSRLVHQKTGKNYTELLHEKRLSQATWFLNNTDWNVDEIARAVGYENMTYFHRLFRERFGVSPRQYRNCK
ncbi:MAG: helix-turn-helix domain-containing protein [Oscillospiraceae bacterium]|nr:helix-turn-helix domain-containing protein [Oscillospiraceae bacterium]